MEETCLSFVVCSVFVESCVGTAQLSGVDGEEESRIYTFRRDHLIGVHLAYLVVSAYSGGPLTIVAGGRLLLREDNLDVCRRVACIIHSRRDRAIEVSDRVYACRPSLRGAVLIRCA